MDHGLGSAVLATMLEEIARANDNPGLAALASNINDPFQISLFSNEMATGLETEFRVPTANGRIEFIDILVRRDKWLFLIENKIDAASKTKGQLLRQFQGLESTIEKEEATDMSVGGIYLVPAARGSEGWTVMESALEEVSFTVTPPNFAVLMTWQETDDKTVPSFAGMIQSLFDKESRGIVSPISADVKQLLLAFLNFINEEFTGYPFERKVSGRPSADTYSVSQLLNMDNPELFIGVQYGLYGLITKAWRNPEFINQTFKVVEGPNGWQYLSLAHFKKVAAWAMNPDTASLEGVEWRGKPFGNRTLYVVSGAKGLQMYVGIRGGLSALKSMTAEEIQKRNSWELSNEERTSSWFPAEEFRKVLEEKGISYDGP